MPFPIAAVLGLAAAYAQARQQQGQQASQLAAMQGQKGGGMQPLGTTSSETAMQTQANEANADPSQMRPQHTLEAMMLNRNYAADMAKPGGNVYDQKPPDQQTDPAETQAKGGKLNDMLGKAAMGAQIVQAIRGNAPRPPGLPGGGGVRAAQPGSGDFTVRPGSGVTLNDFLRRRRRGR